MTTKSLVILGTIAAILLSSCKTPRYVYSPPVHNDPHFEKKGETKLAAYYSGGDNNGAANSEHQKNNGYDLQAGYAINDHWGVTASYFSRRERDVYPSSDSMRNIFYSSQVNYKRKLTEIGTGYFGSIDRRNTVFASIYGGVGFGKFYINDLGENKDHAVYQRFHRSNITKYYIQPSVYFHAGEYLRLSFGGRLSFVHYGNIVTSYSNEELNYFELNHIVGRTLTFVEPDFYFQFIIPGCEWMKVESGVAFSFGPGIGSVRSRGACLTAGLVFDFSKTKK